MGVVIMLLSSLLLISFQAFLTTGAPAAGSCGDFLEGACDLSEDNIIGHDRFTPTAGECQDKCGQNPTCTWFTHFDTQCYLLAVCGDSAHCEGCVSGTTDTDFDTCPWPPSPDTTTPKTTPTTTTKSTTPKTTPTTTKPTTTKPTTKPTTNPTTPSGSCGDIVYNEVCDWDSALIQYYEHVMTAGECQNICRSLDGARFFSHYNQGDDYRKYK